MPSSVIDYMEYATDAAVQAKYVTNSAVSTVDKTTSGTATASHTYSTKVASRAIDNSEATEFAMGGGYGTVGAWWQVQLVSAAAICKLRYKGKTGENTGKLKVQACNDGASFVDISPELTIANNNIWQDFTWSNSIPYTYWRLTITQAGPTTDMVVYEIEMMTASLQSYSEATIKTQGDYALKSTAEITSSLNKTLTYTLASPLNLSNALMIYFDIRALRTGSNIKVSLLGDTAMEVTPNIAETNVFQTASLDVSAIPNSGKDAVTSIVITISNADAENILYIDNLYATFPDDVNVSGTILDINNNPVIGVTVTLVSDEPDEISTDTDENGDFTLLASVGYDVTITPTKTGCYFSPESYTYETISEEQLDQDFVCYVRTPLKKIVIGLKKIISRTEEVCLYALRIIQNVIINGTLTVIGQTTLNSTLTGIIKGTAGVLSAITAGSANQILGINNAGTNYEYKTIEGTANQVNVVLTTANKITLSAPQNIHSGASPTFAGATIGTLAGLVKADAGVLSALALGTANYKLFMNAAGTAPEFASGIYIGTFTRDQATGAGDVSYTGIGFKPSWILFLANQNDSARLSIGYDKGGGSTNGNCVYNNHEAGAYSWKIDDGRSIMAQASSTNNVRANVKTMDADGFTLSWALTGSQTGTLTVRYIAFR